MGMTYPKPPRHLVSLADDNQLGFLVVASLLLAGPGISNYMGWADFLGTGRLATLIQLPMMVIGLTLLMFCLGRLLRPGCQIMLRINHGGLTDFRLRDTPLQWHEIHKVSRLSGPLCSRLPLLLLDLEPTILPLSNETLFSKVLHFPLRRKNSHQLIVFCGSLDSPTDEVMMTIEAHLANK